MTYNSKSRFSFDSIKIKFMLVILLILIYVDQSMTTKCYTSCTCDQFQTDMECKKPWPSSFPMNVTKLNLTYNDVSFFQLWSIRTLLNLKELSLEHNTISYIEEGAIRDLPTLNSLSLEHNRISFIQEGAIRDLPTLNSLTLKYNKISYFEEAALKNLTELKNLAMKYNNITYFNEAAFKDLPKLENLYLYYNRITFISNGKFRNLNNLKSLHLYGNRLPSIPSTMFQHLPSLEKLILRNNQIRRFQDGSFLFLPNIIEIDLRDNKDLFCGCHLPAVVDYINKTYNRHVIVRSHCNMGHGPNQLNIIHPSRYPLCHDYSLFQKKLQCQTCSGLKCYNPEVTNCYDAEPFCMSRISMTGHSIKFEKSCSTYRKCIEAEKKNVFTCKTLNNGSSCVTCCTGNLCNKNDLFSFTGSFHFPLSFAINLTTYNWNRNAIEFKNTAGIRLSAEMQMELESKLAGSTKVEYCGFRQNQVMFDIYCTVLKIISEEELLSNIKTILHASKRFDILNRIQRTGTGFCCESTTSTNKETLYWPVTKIRTTVKIPCYASMATRYCNSQPTQCLSPSNCQRNSLWGEPDISECNNTDWITRKLKDMEQYDIEKQNTEDLSTQLLYVTQKSPYFKVKDINLAVNICENIASQVSNVSTNTTTNYILHSINDMIDTPEKILVEAEQSKRSAKRILDVVEAITENIQLKEEQLSASYSNLGIGVTKMENTNFNGSFYGILSDTNGKAARNMVHNSSYPDPQQENVAMMDFISLPKSLFKHVARENLSTISKVLFYSMSNDKLFRVIEKADNKTSSKINSHIIAANIPNIQIANLVDPVTISFSLLDKNATNLQCAFWDETPGQTPHWSTKGCDTSDYIPGEKVLCSCNHLTSFALLMDVYQNEETVKSVKILSAISNIGCGISFVSLILTVIVHVCFRNLWKLITSKILVNLCSSLAVTNLIFLVGMQSYVSKIIAVCKTIAALLHYFLLTTMMWMTIEAIHICLSVIVLSTTYQKYFMIRSSVLAWGLPAIIVIITLAINYTNNYIRIAEVCWLSKIPFYTALLLPIVIILAINLTIFSLVIWRLVSVQSNKKFEHKTRKVRVWGIAGLFCLLGLSWFLAFFTFGEVAEVFKYLFVIFNTLQGLFIFIFYCLYKKDTRDIICMSVRRQKEKDLQKSTKNEPSSSSVNQTKATTFEITQQN
ncbi:adhesion G-protein coupled receptor G6-like isoform X4 [Octopus sinensis]|uniref:Adhesion G-protein coupled receptor G6-like isoform X4 n=1 Tax=Octopus sinensis TaxID=2607531 RepID=A0A7E6F1R7_9MOLL|nr:adhesion G-protein coupled receptor G6-like isoform X4 [Octopus sinensis]